MNWITRWDEIDDDQNYLICAITGDGKKVYDAHLARGWQVKQRIEGCYAAILLPPFQGITWPTKTNGEDKVST